MPQINQEVTDTPTLTIPMLADLAKVNDRKLKSTCNYLIGHPTVLVKLNEHLKNNSKASRHNFDKHLLRSIVVCKDNPSQTPKLFFFGKTIGSGGFGTVKKAYTFNTNGQVFTNVVKIDRSGVFKFSPSYFLSPFSLLADISLFKKTYPKYRENKLISLSNAVNGHKFFDQYHGQLTTTKPNRFFKALKNFKTYEFMDYIEGGNLFDVLDSWILKVIKTKKDDKSIYKKAIIKELLRTLISAATVINTAHEAGYAHRDIKPENIMLDDTKRCHLVDRAGFRNKQTHSVDGLLLGTNGYAAPEIINSNRSSYLEADRYSFGATIEYMRHILMHQCNLFENDETISFEIHFIEARLMRYDPKERITVKEAKEALENIYNQHFEHKAQEQPTDSSSSSHSLS